MSALRWENALGTFGAGFLMAKLGWRPVFIGIGLISLFWLPAWTKWMPRNDSNDLRSGPAFLSILDILRQRSFWGTCIGAFCCNYLFYFMITWLPSYLVLQRHLSMVTMTWTAGVYYSVDATSALATGWIQDFYIHKGFAVTLVRKLAMTIAFSIAAIATYSCAFAGSDTFVWWLIAAGIGCGATSPGVFAFCQTLAGPRVVGRWYGGQNGFANFAGVVAPALTGFAVQRTGNFVVPFVVTSALCLIGILAWVFIVGQVEPISWTPKGNASRAALIA